MLKGGLVLILELGMNLVPTLILNLNYQIDHGTVLNVGQQSDLLTQHRQHKVQDKNRTKNSS